VPQVSFDEHGLSIGGRRIWIMGAAVESSLVPPEEWPRTLATLRRSGFNTIRTSAPWNLHEPRPQRISFEGSLDLRAFVEACREQELWVIVRIGPVVGGTFDGGGLPAWLSEIAGLRPREPQDAFMQLVSRWYSAALAQLKGLTAMPRREGAGGKSRSGGVLAVQIEHGWDCGNAPVGDRYLAELRRFVREAGVEVPVMTANGLWAGVEETIDVWQGSDDLFSHVRQLRGAQPHAPAIVEVDGKDARRALLALGTADRADPAHTVVARVARVLAAGGQAIVGHAAPEVHRSSPAGAGVDGRSSANAVEPRLVDWIGARTPALEALSPLALFASSFGAITAVDTGAPAVVVDPEQSLDAAPIVVTRSSSAGTTAFVFRSEGSSTSAVNPPSSAGGRGRDKLARGGSARAPQDITLVTGDGMRLPVSLGKWPVAWFPIGLDLGGRARLDYAALSPIAFIDQKLLVLVGAAGTSALLSIGGAEHRVGVPDASGSAKPTLASFAGLTIAVCNERQAEALSVESKGVVIGAASIGSDGPMTRARGFREVVRLESSGSMKVVPSSAAEGSSDAQARRSGRTEDSVRSVSMKRSHGSTRIALEGWRCAEATMLASGRSARFASMLSPRSLASFAPRRGMGWYRLRLQAPRRETLLWFPGATGVLHAYLDGHPIASIGEGDRMPLRIPAARGGTARSTARRADDAPAADECTVVLLAVEHGRPVSGLASALAAGLRGEGWIVALLSSRISSVDSPVFDPFAVRGFVPGAPGRLPEKSVEISLTIERGTPIVIDPGEPFYGAVLLNGKLVDVFDLPAQSTSGVVLAPSSPGWANGRAAITLVPMRASPGLARSVRAFKRVEAISTVRRGHASWAFARWEIPDPASAEWRDADAARHRRSPASVGVRGDAGGSRGIPAYWMTCVRADGACSVELDGLTTGVIHIDDAPIGRYDTTFDERLPLPPNVLAHGARLTIFDDAGASPSRVSIMSIM